MTKENITRRLAKCPSCGNVTPYEDGYCERCDPPSNMQYARGAKPALPDEPQVLDWDDAHGQA